MSRLAPGQLTEKDIDELTTGQKGDGGGLWLVVKGGSRLWELRYKSPVTGKRRQMTLGSARLISLKEARSRTITYHRMMENGLDPIDERKKNRAGTSRHPTRAEAAYAASLLLRCGTDELNRWTGGRWPDDKSVEALTALATTALR